MLRGKHHDLLHLLTILESLEKILAFSREANDAESFYKLNDQMNFNAVLNLLAHVGETSDKLSEDFLQAIPTTDWKKIKALRNRIVHDEVPVLLNELYVNTQKRHGERLLRQSAVLPAGRLTDGTTPNLF